MSAQSSSDAAKPTAHRAEGGAGRKVWSTYKFLAGHPAALNTMRLCGALLLVLSGYEIGH